MNLVWLSILFAQPHTRPKQVSILGTSLYGHVSPAASTVSVTVCVCLPPDVCMDSKMTKVLRD